MVIKTQQQAKRTLRKIGRIRAVAFDVRSFFQQNFTLEDAIGSHACSLEANKRVTNGIPHGCSLLLPVGTAICVQTLKGEALANGETLEGFLAEVGARFAL
jgi:hypothetical protein